ncbi:DUF3592 domain-containing protein [Roseiflexus sp.]
MTGLQFAALFLLLMGGAFLVGGGYFFWQSRPFQNGMECSAVVIDIASRPDEDGGGDLYAPVVRFVARNGQEVTITGAVFSRPCPYKIGQTVTVEYPAQAPERGRIKSESRLMYIAFGIIGGVITVIGLILGVIAFWNG